MGRRDFLKASGLIAIARKPDKPDPLVSGEYRNPPAVVQWSAGLDGKVGRLREAIRTTEQFLQDRGWDQQPVVDGIIYDRIRIPAGFEVSNLHKALYFFTDVGPEPCPVSGKMKTLADCNMHRSGRLSAPESFLVKQIVFSVGRKINQSDFSAMMECFYWEFVIAQRIYARSPFLVKGPTQENLATLPAPVTVETLPRDSQIRGEYVDAVGGLCIFDQHIFHLSVNSGTPYKFKGDCDFLVALRGLHAQGVC